MSTAAEWFTNNRLIVNARKSNIIFIGSPQRLQNITDEFSVTLGPSNIDRSVEIKLLGLIFDQHLNFSKHTAYLVKKVSPKISLLHRLRRILDQSTLVSVYQAIVQSHFDYCITVWGNCPKSYV